ncbi:piggyBac transposable element-derived protein 4-like [Hydra vulgaris]|uniref:PiggyBac transposable element-derived protein 4-like n=1 Tax=Hydra vulgaris TaxID=6087 RepID=A0ABM4C907_HYDVU
MKRSSSANAEDASSSKTSVAAHPLSIDQSVTHQRPKRVSAQQCLFILQDLSEIDSGDESDSTKKSDEADVVEDNLSDDDESSTFINSSESSSDENKDENSCGGSNDLTVKTRRDDVKWTVVSKVEVTGSFQTLNVFTAKSGTTSYCRNVLTPIDAFRLIMDEGFTRFIKKCTVLSANLSNEGWNISDIELDAFIGLIYLRGCMNARNFPVKFLWSEKYGNKAFIETMPRSRFEDIMKNIRFDIRSKRRELIQSDKFSLMSWVLTRFVENSQKCYIPEESLTIDEQLFPTKARCRFTQYMPNKPDKFGIKFWILADLKTKYCLSIKPYLGKDESRVENLGTHVVMSLMEPYLGHGYNVTTDNFFTSVDLATKLLQKKTSIVGTVKHSRKEIPAFDPLPLYDSSFYINGPLNLIVYQAKKKKTVILLSTLHRGATKQSDGKKKPEGILYYNANKCGVDMLDSMCRQMSTKSGCRRWPLAVFFNILDLTGVNAWIIFKKVTQQKISRRKFLYTLSEQLREANITHRKSLVAANSNTTTATNSSTQLSTRLRCQIKTNCKRNLTSIVCESCKKPVCGKCMSNICKYCK